MDVPLSVADRRGSFLVASAMLAVIAGLCLLFDGKPVPQFAIIAPITYFVAVIADIATAFILLTTWKTASAPRSTVVLGISYAVNGCLLFVSMLTLPLLPATPPVVASPPQFGIWVFVLWHVSVAAGALAYVWARHKPATSEPSNRFTFVVAGVALTFVCVSIGLAFTLARRLPLAAGASVGALASTGIGPILTVLLAAAAIGVFRLRDPGPIDRALTLALVALTLEIASFTIGGHRYDLNYYSGRLLILVSCIIVLATAIRVLIAARSQLNMIQWTLRQVEDQSAKRAARIHALGKISEIAMDGREHDRFKAVLDLATATLRPGRPMLGLLSHLDGEVVVVDETSTATHEKMPHPAARKYHPGATFDLRKSLHDRLLGEERTRAWDDVGVAGAPWAADATCRSFIGTHVKIARETYFVAFFSTEPMTDEPFTNEDFAYVDVIASFFRSTFTQQQQFARIQFQIEHDALTGLENRVQFRKALRDEIRRGRPFSMAFVDLDGFRHVNEREGSQIGDEVLVEVAAALVGVAGENTVARMSADEFAVLLRDDVSSRSLTHGIKRYADLFLTPFSTGDRDGTRRLQIGASIGASRYPVDGATAEDLMLRADCALSVAKARGGSTTMVFEPAMSAILERSHLRVVELSNGIARDQLVLAYQPTFDIATRTIIGAEALVRWDHPERGRLPPSEFIEFAERNGLIGAISRWVFHRVVRDVTGCERLPANVRVYFNLAAQMLDDIPFITEMNATLQANPSLVRHLGIEVTETAAMQNVERSMSTIELFRRWGISVAVDDFGTGYSSLSYLKQLSVDVIKIDRSFIENLTLDERDGLITDMLLRITDQFGFTTLAEGIETEAQLAWLLEHGCRLGQGFLVAKPDTFDEFLHRLGVVHAV